MRLRDTTCVGGRRDARTAGGYVLSTTFLVIFAILLVAVIVGLALVRNALFTRATGEVIKDSASPPNILGKPIGWGICEEPQLLCKDPGRGTIPDPAAGMWALVGVRPDRFVTRNAVYYTNADCADTASASDVYVAPPAAPVPLGDLIPDLPVGYLDGLETVGQMSPLSYGVGAPRVFDFATQMPTGPGLLYRSADEAITTPLISSVWTSLAPDCVLEPLPGGVSTGTLNCPQVGDPGTVASEQKISEIAGMFTGDLDQNDRFGFGVASLGDLDGDGVLDLAAGATDDDDGGSNRGAVWILFLNADGTVKSHQKISSTDGGFTGTLGNNDLFGWGTEALGDLDGDGVVDLAVGARLTDDGGLNRGAFWVLFLNSDGTVKAHQKVSDTVGGFTGTLINNDRFGNSIAALGDLDGDTVVDLAVAAFLDNDGGGDRGAVWILFMNSDGTVKSHQKISDTAGGFTGILDNTDRFGTSVEGLGDLDGDAVPDVAVGANRDDDGGPDTGAVWILFLNSNGTVKGHQKISDTSGGFMGALGAVDFFGQDTTNMGDLDGDGVIDLAVGAILDDDGGSNRGAVWLLFLDTDGTVKDHQKISDTAGGFGGVLSNDDRFGQGLTNLGDLSGDGVPEIVVGAVGDDDGGADRGAVWILSLNGVVTPTTCVPAPDDLVSWWPGDGDASDIADGNAGTLLGGATAAAGGQVGQAFSFDGTSEVNVPSAANLNVQSFTIDAWVYPTVTNGIGDEIVNKETAIALGAVQYNLAIRGTQPANSIPTNNLVFYVGATNPLNCNDGGGWCDGMGQVPLNLWTHVALTYSGGTATAYVNGVATRTVTGYVGPLTTTSGPLRIGSRTPSGSFPNEGFEGRIDEVEFFDRALTACEIQQIYLAGAFGKCKAGEEVFPDALCENITPRSLSLIRAEQVLVDPSIPGSANLLEGPPYVIPFNMMPPMAGPIDPTPELTPLVPPGGNLVPATPEEGK